MNEKIKCPSCNCDTSLTTNRVIANKSTLLSCNHCKSSYEIAWDGTEIIKRKLKALYDYDGTIACYDYEEI